ncbi:hypothetical protein [Actinacidiphila paucisporea]|uniref:Uncharacterized protein n=1 Tax=Actinacidiphila paucisporea TaxID=310782 RepID=A0A1M7P4C5_9ACTN|nr:hypothetical protein [Actinacidiphila paucisporea]SHN11433.1 hypothetical protein SAMN05216499_12137 [Actinacidiphila paucisporea]
MAPLLDVSDEVRAEIGEEETQRLLAGENAPGTYDCTSCRTPGDTGQERTSTVLFVGDETAVLAFAHAACIPSQVVPVSEEQLQGAVRSISGEEEHPAPAFAAPPAVPVQPAAPSPGAAPRQAVLGITCGLIIVEEALCPALVIEPTGPVARVGATGGGDDFLPLLIEQGFMPQLDLAAPPSPLAGWSVLLAMGKLHAVLQPAAGGAPATAWWQAHQPLQVSDGWRAAVSRTNAVYVYAGPAGSIGRQPREDLMRDALAKACARGQLVGATMPLAGTT